MDFVPTINGAQQEGAGNLNNPPDMDSAISGRAMQWPKKRRA